MSVFMSVNMFLCLRIFESLLLLCFVFVCLFLFVVDCYESVFFSQRERERSALPLASLGNKTVDIDRVTDNEFPLFIDNTVFFLHRICENSVPCPCL